MSILDSWLETLPAPLRASADSHWDELQGITEEAGVDWYRRAADDPQRVPQLGTLLACSPAAVDLCRRQPAWLAEMDAAGELEGHLGPEAYHHGLGALGLKGLGAGSAEDFDRALRQFRNRAWLRIVWRDLNRLATLAETVRDLSRLAEACIERALDFHHHQLARDLGEPRSDSGEPQRLVVLAMGKLGAGELNLSSDIDLIFTFPEGGHTQGGARRLDNQEFFIRLGQRLIKSLDQRSGDGFVFRVDMRLRPHGQSGPLVISFDAMEEYYQDQGRDWERYAMIKARSIAGDIRAGETLLARLRPFVYRRYVDFSAIESLRDMKGMILREVQRRGMQDNIKLGSGGIREVEFIAQCFQLIRGGRDRQLQDRRLQVVLDELLVLNYLPAPAVNELKEAYCFLRNTEHAIQAWQDRQTQSLPAREVERQALAWAMGCAGDWARFSAELQAHRARVSEHFSHVIASPEPHSDRRRNNLSRWRDLLDGFAQDRAPQRAETALAEAGHEDPAEAARRLVALLTSNAVLQMQSIGRERLYDFLPLLLESLAGAERPTRTLLRVLPLVEAVLRRTAYLVLLMENPGALERLVRLCDASPWIARQLSAHPVLLDELLNASSLYSVPEKAGLRDELLQQQLRIPEDDLEAHMEALRYFKLAHVLRVAASEIAGTLPLMKVSDYLTFIAEVLLESVLELAWRHLVAKHGQPEGSIDAGAHFVIVGYGKLGGIELGYGSDLDLVFVHDAAAGGSTDGERPLDNSVFFTRLGRRIIHILTVHTRLGPLYEVDMRLRPSGNSGLLVSSFTAFREYQLHQAWTWEHQALVRARVVAGDPRLAQDFEQLRRELLGRPREEARLRAEVRDMRERMRGHLLSAESGDDEALFDLKQSAGGIVDIEFLVQYTVLAWAHAHAPLTVYSDNIRILEALQREKLLADADAQALIEAYKVLRSQYHRLSLQEEKTTLPAGELLAQRAQVIALWQRLLESA